MVSERRPSLGGSENKCPFFGVCQLDLSLELGVKRNIPSKFLAMAITVSRQHLPIVAQKNIELSKM